MECYKDFETAGEDKTPVAKHIAERVLTLPLYADLDIDTVNKICDIILD
jgi:dTDP-4-amino-4,6-dideoxygalactose transaminase